MAGIPHARAEELLAQVGWMRELASGLLVDPGAAEDVVQETWIAALRHPPRSDRPLEAWLARVVRNFAWKRRRSEARRVEHEHRAAASELTSGPEVTLERLELQRTVLGAVEAIREPFRTVLVERYLEGRSSADIARAQGLPEGTVRWRLKRAVDELRARLDAEFGERATWCALLAPLVSAPPHAGSAGSGADDASVPRTWLEPGVLVMVGASKLVLAAILAATAVGVVLWRQEVESRGAPPAVALSGPEPSAAKVAEPLVETAPAHPAPQREAPAPVAERAPASVPVEARESDAQASPVALLDMRFVDAQGAPWEDVDVSLLFVEETCGTSGPDGRVELRLEPDPGLSQWTTLLVARRAGCVPRKLRAVVMAGRSTHLGDVLLEPGARVEGRVLDESGGLVADAEVGLTVPELFAKEEHIGLAAAVVEGGEPEEQLRHADEELARRHGTSAFDRDVSTRSSADGTFVLEGVAAGRWRLWAHGTGTRFGWSEPFEVLAGKDVFGVTVRLPALLDTDRITGVVLDPAGRPVPFARLVSTYQLEIETSSTTKDVGPDGRFDLVIRRDAVHSFIASDPERRYADAILLDVAPGARDVELRLGEKRSFEVSVHARDGKALDDCRFTLGTQVGGLHREDESPASVIEPGVYGLQLPTLPFDLRAEVDGFLPARLEELRPESVGARLEVLLEPAPRLQGRVLAEGKPVPHARVELHRAVEGGYWTNGFACAYEPKVERETSCDEAGRFELACRGTEPVWLRASGQGWVDGDLGPLDPLSAGELTLELSAGGSLEGHVLVPDDASAQGIVVGIHHGDGRPRTLRVGPDGFFRFDHLMPGSWKVQRCEDEPNPSSTTVGTSSDPHEIRWSCTVEVSRTTRFDLDLSRP